MLAMMLEFMSDYLYFLSVCLLQSNSDSLSGLLFNFGGCIYGEYKVVLSIYRYCVSGCLVHIQSLL